jgi:hypothetical protein
MLDWQRRSGIDLIIELTNKSANDSSKVGNHLWFGKQWSIVKSSLHLSTEMNWRSIGQRRMHQSTFEPFANVIHPIYETQEFQPNDEYELDTMNTYRRTSSQFTSIEFLWSNTHKSEKGTMRFQWEKEKEREGQRTKQRDLVETIDHHRLQITQPSVCLTLPTRIISGTSVAEMCHSSMNVSERGSRTNCHEESQTHNLHDSFQFIAIFARNCN